jgi:hypothetical protein
MGWEPRFSEEELREVVSAAMSLSDVLRGLGLRPGGGNHRSLRKLLLHYGIPTDHFDPDWARKTSRRAGRIPLDEVMVENSTYGRGHLKRRLFEEGLKHRACELCGQGEQWHGKHMSLILDHINGVPDDNRLENLRVVCPNCAATFETHCGRKNRAPFPSLDCRHCGREFVPRYESQRYCSRACGQRSSGRREPKPETRKVPRPSYGQLVHELRTMTWRAVGRKYGVSDNAVRKWIRWYEQTGDTAGGELSTGA